MFKKEGHYTPIRLPAEVKDWLRRKAERGLSSMSAEATRILLEAMDAEQREQAVR